MKNTILFLAVVLAVLVAGFYALNAYIYTEKQADAPPEASRFLF